MAATKPAIKSFNSLMSELDYPMFIVTTVADDGERSGCLIGFATQISIKPPRFLAGLSHKNHTYRVAQRADHLGVHFVPADGTEIAELFGSETGDEIDKFERCEWHEGPEGVPIVAGLPNWFVGRIVDRLDAGHPHGAVLHPLRGAPPGRGPGGQLPPAHRLQPGGPPP